MNVEEVSTDWVLARISIADLDQTKEFEDAIKEYMSTHPAFMMEYLRFNRSIENDKLVMLAANLTLVDVQDLQKSWPYEDYVELIERCKKVLKAEKVEDFLKRLKTGISTPPDEEEKDPGKTE